MLDDPLRAVVLGLERHDHAVGGHQGRPGRQVDVRRAVDQDRVEVAADLGQGVAEQELVAAAGPRLGAG